MMRQASVQTNSSVSASGPSFSFQTRAAVIGE